MVENTLLPRAARTGRAMDGNGMSTSVIEVPSSVTVRSVADFGQYLSSTLAEHDEIVLDTDAMAELDLSFVQLVQAARMEDGKTVRLARPANEAVTALLRRAGFLTEPLDADLDFWFHGELPR
jgi:hypothetical protein